MAIPLESIPRFTAEQAAAIAGDLYGVRGEAAGLPSERDQNFLIVTAAGERVVLKIANGEDTAELLDFQNQAMSRVRAAEIELEVQRVLLSRRGRDIEAAAGHAGRRHAVRLLAWVDGDVLAKARPRGTRLLESIGAALAHVDLALRELSHPGMDRILQWDIRHAPLAREHLSLLRGERRMQVERHFSRFEALDWKGLRQSVIHGDANDHNVLVRDGRMSGLLDFGDSVSSATACELAIALTYTMLGEGRPLETASHLTRAYTAVMPLTRAERDALPVLVLARLAMSVCYSAHNRARSPGDPYQVVSEAQAWDLLERLEPLAADGSLAF